jgi:C1A family cysteine protease
MKRTSLKLFAFLLAAIMVLALLPTAALAEGRIEELREARNQKNYGYVRTPEHGTRAVSDAYVRGDMETYYRLSGIQPTRDTLPSLYNSNTLGYVTSVKNQNPYGSCWAHAAMASVESYMIKHGIEVGSTGSAATTSLNLSETQHCFFNYSSAYDAEGMLTGDKCTLTGSDSCLDSGGNGEMSAYTLQRWCGAADESQSALAYSKASTVASSGLNSQYAYQYNICHVQNSEWIPATDIEGVKRAIMQYGAGNISYYAGNSNYTYNCTIDTSSTSSSSHKWSNHAITVIGWDDSIAKSKFSPNQPSGNGAWLCKNSWGTSYFDQGYMWISYEDTSVLEGYIYFYDAEPIDNYDHNYQYDGTCNPVTYGIGNRTGFANNTKVANVFTAKGTERLEAVALCNWDEALTYTLEIYKNPTTGNPSSGTLMTTQTGTLTYSGYYTIKLDNPFVLAAGDTFSVVFTQNVPVADDNGKYVHTPYDASFNDTSLVSWAKWTHTNHGNTSYYQEPNGSWTDCPDNGDYRIKAYTKDVTFTVTAVSNNTAWGTVSVNGTKITATPAAGYYVSGYEVTSGAATATINGNVINVAPESDCTIEVIFAEKPTYTVSYIASGSAAGSVSAQIYDVINLPTSVSTVADGWTFSGWVTATIAETNAAPTFYAPGAAYTVTANTTLYALFTRTEGTGELIYRLVNDNLSDWSGNYIITCGKDTSALVLKGLSGNTRYESTSAGGSVTFSNTGMTLDGEIIRNANNAYVFVVEKTGSNYTMKNASTGTYLGSYRDTLYSRSSYSSSYCNWGVEYDLYNICMKVSNSASSNYPYLVKGSNSYFVVNSTHTTNKTQFWKEETERTIYYNTDPVTPEPAFDKKCSVVLSGQIGMNFYMTIPEEYINTNTNPEVTFTIAADEKSRTTTAIGEKLDDGRYKFTCLLTSIEMADRITAVYSYEVDDVQKTISKDAIVRMYLEDLLAQTNDTETKDLVKALADYGHYVQLYLKGIRNWEFATDYKKMELCYTQSYAPDEVLTAVNSNAIVREDNSDAIEKITFSLVLDSETAIRVYFKMAEGYNGAFTVTGAATTAEKLTDGRYLVEIKNIGASKIGDEYEFNVATDGNGTAHVKVSALSYVQAMLKNAEASDDAKNAVCAIYYYYKAAQAFLNAHQQ